MSKKSIIICSSLLLLIAVLFILFGVVFCLRKEYVSVLGEQPLVQLVQNDNGEYTQVELTKKQIIKAANFKHGKPIFLLDKQQAINNIQKTYPMVKVVQIKTKSVVSVQIVVRPRQETYYIQTKVNQDFGYKGYYVMDEELMTMKPVPFDKPEEIVGYVELNIDELDSNLKNSNTDLGNYLMAEKVRKITSNLYNSFCSTVSVEGEGINPTAKPNATREDFTRIVKLVTLYKPSSTGNQDLNELIEDTINMSLNVMLNGSEYTINIAVAEKDLQQKVNMSFNTVASYLNSGNDLGGKTTFNCGYDADHNITIELV